MNSESNNNSNTFSMKIAAIQQLDIFPKEHQSTLPSAFKPLPYSVIIGKGRQPRQAIGNRRLRTLVESQLANYSVAKFRKDKGCIVSNIIHAIKESCPEGAFVKFDGQRWWEVSESTAREKVSATFRDMLSDQYKSSTKNKVARRRVRKALASSSRKTPENVTSTISSSVTSQHSVEVNEPELPESPISKNDSSEPSRQPCAAFEQAVDGVPTSEAAVVSSGEEDCSIMSDLSDDFSDVIAYTTSNNAEITSSSRRLSLTIEDFDGLFAGEPVGPAFLSIFDDLIPDFEQSPQISEYHLPIPEMGDALKSLFDC
jgi:hypothetical protein